VPVPRGRRGGVEEREEEEEDDAGDGGGWRHGCWSGEHEGQLDGRGQSKAGFKRGGDQ
jgi:hypothetical protein